MKRKVSFKRDGLTLIGTLFTPDNFEESGHYKAIIVEGSATSVKEQMPELYAQNFANEEFVVLAFDYSHYGESEGKPRQLEDPATKLNDLKAAVSYLTSLPYVQAVGMVGVCTSAGNAAYLAADDTRVKAIATVAGYLPEPSLINGLFGEAEVTRRRELADAAKSKFEQSGVETIVTAYSETDQTAANFAPAGAFDYYLNRSRGNIPEWKNELAVMSYESLYDFDPISKASAIKIPTMVVHSDGSSFPDQAKKFYSLLQGEKELVWADGSHFDYYDQPTQVNNAVKNVTRFFNKHLF
ncbi:MAG: alpha/beta hydrolase [Acidobacteriota bacterium]